MELQNGRPENVNDRLDKEIRVYDFLDKLSVTYQRVDHEAAMTMEACEEIDRTLGDDTAICKNLFLCNRQETNFYLLLMPGDKPFKTKDLSAQIGSARLSFAKPEYMEKYLDITPGSVSVLGLMNDHEKKVQLLIDEDVLKDPYFGCHPCINTSSLKFTTKDFAEKIIPALEHEPIIVNYQSGRTKLKNSKNEKKRIEFMQKQLTFKKFFMETLILTGAVAIIAAAVYFFLVPSHTSVSSISGLGIVLSNFVPLPLSAITMILNVVLLIIGFFTCGKEFGIKTVYTSIMLPVFLGIFEKVFPNFASMSNSQELDVLCYILVVSIGLSILFNRNASSGGLDIVAKIMNKYLHMELGKAMSLSGMCVALSAALVYDKKTVVLSILGTYFNGIVLDHFIFDHNIKRRVCIITKKEEELRNFIIHDLHSGATVYEAYGAYNMQKRNEIITIVDKTEYQKLMNYINHEDPQAFITVYNVSDMRYQPKV